MNFDKFYSDYNAEKRNNHISKIHRISDVCRYGPISLVAPKILHAQLRASNRWLHTITGGGSNWPSSNKWFNYAPKTKAGKRETLRCYTRNCNNISAMSVWAATEKLSIDKHTNPTCLIRYNNNELTSVVQKSNKYIWLLFLPPLFIVK